MEEMAGEEAQVAGQQNAAPPWGDRFAQLILLGDLAVKPSPIVDRSDFESGIVM
jgi:hypothetical protein|tara:strand:- start:6537 stop:6698 length:162 start_codon:yes stop_codon:yes gene_type:complete